jgi:hypothetical protein
MAYSITTKDGITINNIPDDVAPDSPDLKSRVEEIRAGKTESRAAPREAVEEPSMGERIGRQVGLTARALPGAAANIAGLVGDPLNALINAITGSKLQTISGATENLMTMAGLPEPTSPSEKLVYDINRAAASAVLPGVAIRAATPTAPVRAAPQARVEPTLAQPISAESITAPIQRAFSENLGLQATGAVGGTLASQLAAQSGAGPVGQAVSGLLGGVLAPAGVQTAAERVVVGGKELVRPFTEAGRQVIAGNVLRQVAAEPETAMMRAATYEPTISGYRPTTAQATRDVGLVSVEPTIKSMDVTGRFAQQQSMANQARVNILDRMTKDKSAVSSAIAKRDEVTTPLREEAFARSTVTPEVFQSGVSLTVNKTIDDILASPAGKRGTVISVMEDTRDDIARATNPAELYEIRKDLRAAERGLLDKSDRGGPSKSAYDAARGELNKVISAVDDAIDSAAPGYRDYLKKYAASSRGIERLEAIQDFGSRVKSTIPDPITGDYLLSQASFVKAIRGIEKDKNLGGLSKAQLSMLKRVGQDLDDGVLARATRPAGSDTFKNMSTANVIGGIVGKQIFGETSPLLSKVAAPLNWLYNGTDDAIREVLVDAMLDPKLASRLMQKATTATIQPVSQELQRRAINLGYGSIFGLE